MTRRPDDYFFNDDDEDDEEWDFDYDDEDDDDWDEDYDDEEEYDEDEDDEEYDDEEEEYDEDDGEEEYEEEEQHQFSRTINRSIVLYKRGCPKSMVLTFGTAFCCNKTILNEMKLFLTTRPLFARPNKNCIPCPDYL